MNLRGSYSMGIQKSRKVLVSVALSARIAHSANPVRVVEMIRIFFPPILLTTRETIAHVFSECLSGLNNPR